MYVCMCLCVSERERENVCVCVYGYMCMSRCLSAGRLWLTQVGVLRAEPIDLSAVNKPSTHILSHTNTHSCVCTQSRSGYRHS